MNDEGSLTDEDLTQLAVDHMVDLAYTYKTFYKMSRYVVFGGWIMDTLVVIATSLLTVSLVRQSLSTEMNIALATGAAILSFFTLFVRFDKMASAYEQAGDAYNSLFKEFREFCRISMKDNKLSNDEKKKRLEELTQRHRDLNEYTPATSDWVYRRLDDDDVLGNVEVTEKERKRLIDD